MLPAMQEMPTLGAAEIPGARERRWALPDVSHRGRSGEPSQGPFLAERESPSPGAASEASAPLHGPETAPRQRQANAMDESLSTEIRILDIARAAVDAHNPAAAHRALDSYTQRFPHGRLKPEATVLRLAVLVRQGNRATARSLAAQLLASESYKAYEYRIRSLLREAGE